MNRIECFEFMNQVRKDQLVVCGLGLSSNDWFAATGDETTFYMRSSMGMVSSFSLGLSMALPQRKIWGIEGDGAFCMNMGTLLTMASTKPKNLVHFIMSNRHYESTGGQPLVNSQQTDYVAIARGAGLERAYSFEKIEELKQQLPGILESDEFSLIFLEVEMAKSGLGPKVTETKMSIPFEMAYRFIRHVEQTEGKKVLD